MKHVYSRAGHILKPNKAQAIIIGPKKQEFEFSDPSSNPDSSMFLSDAGEGTSLAGASLFVPRGWAYVCPFRISHGVTSGQVSMWSTPVANILYYGLHRPLDCVRNSSRWHSKVSFKIQT